MPFDYRAAFKTPDPFGLSACPKARTHPMNRATDPICGWLTLIMKRLVASCDRRDAGWGSYRRGRGDHAARAGRQIVAPIMVTGTPRWRENIAFHSGREGRTGYGHLSIKICQARCRVDWHRYCRDWGTSNVTASEIGPANRSQCDALFSGLETRQREL